MSNDSQQSGAKTSNLRTYRLVDPEDDLYSDAMDMAVSAYHSVRHGAMRNADRAGETIDGEKLARRALAAGFRAYLQEVGTCAQVSTERPAVETIAEYASVHVISVPWCQCCEARVPADHVCSCETESLREIRIGDAVTLERYRARGEHEGWIVIWIRDMPRGKFYDLRHPQGGQTGASADEVRLAVKASDE